MTTLSSLSALHKKARFGEVPPLDSEIATYQARAEFINGIREAFPELQERLEGAEKALEYAESELSLFVERKMNADRFAREKRQALAVIRAHIGKYQDGKPFNKIWEEQP